MQEAVEWGSDHTAQGKICLLSSGAPSYNLFKDFGERGDAFIAAVNALPAS
jgi:UDP-N-acetylmuramoylalanine-D-glutamate ligase